MIRDVDIDASFSSVIPDKFYEDNNSDWYGRLIVNTYIKQKDGSYKRGRLANIKAGNIFKLVNPLTETINDPKVVEYRALKDCKYCKTQDNVMIYATLLTEYTTEVNLPVYKFEPPNPDTLCRG